MEEQQQKDVAVFRFGVISDFVTRSQMERGEQERLLREKCQQSWQIPHSNRSRLTRSTILGWIRAYRVLAAARKSAKTNGQGVGQGIERAEECVALAPI